MSNDPEKFFDRMGVDPALQKDAPKDLPPEVADLLSTLAAKLGGDVKALELEGPRKNIVILNLLAYSGPVLNNISRVIAEGLIGSSNHANFNIQNDAHRALIIGNVLKFLQAKKPELDWRQPSMIESNIGEAMECMDWLLEDIEGALNLEGMPESLASELGAEAFADDLRAARYELSQLQERQKGVTELAEEYFSIEDPNEQLEHALKLEAARQLVHPLTTKVKGATEYTCLGGFDKLEDAIEHARNTLAVNVIQGTRDKPFEDYCVIYEPSTKMVEYFQEQTKNTLKQLEEQNPGAEVLIPSEIRDGVKKFFLLHGATEVHVGALDFPRRAGQITREIIQFCSDDQVERVHAVMDGGVSRMRHIEGEFQATTLNDLVKNSLERAEQMKPTRDEDGEDIMVLVCQTWLNPELYPKDNYELASLRLFPTEEGLSYEAFDLIKEYGTGEDAVGVANSNFYACRAFWDYIKRTEDPEQRKALVQELVDRTLVHSGNGDQRLFIPFYVDKDNGEEEIPEDLP